MPSSHFVINQLSDKNWYLLKEYNDEILAKSNDGLNQERLDFFCEQKKIKILKRKARTTWLSWNYPDYKNLKLINSEK